MPHSENAIARLLDSLSAAGLGVDLKIEEGAAGIASPSRLATEWAGFHVTGNEGSWYAKVLHVDMLEVVDFERAACASECAGQSDAAPHVRHVDRSNRVLIFNALPAAQWRSAHLDDLLTPSGLEALWALKRQVHAGPVPDFARSPLRDIHHLRELCLRDNVALPAEHLWIERCVEMAWQALQPRSVHQVPVHGDGAASNVMVSVDGDLRLIDFDHGGCMDPWYDVAVTLNELFSFEGQWREGIAAWAGECREEDYAVCRLYALIDDWYWTLWGLWTGTTSARQLEFSKVGQWTLLRCRQGVQDPRLESWLRQVERGRA
ncbi:aminoglycoside phosphotransferase family protein [Pseudomonas sp. CDFA 602]|uniref:phosphotransferase family protein n=1 Tax=Pseudomonas californiensis TaxID=2829823 RepID=UPI001E31AFF7|nr:aminoglycoside phosphotransferase family protein [Pseudomonas californiensis]MCD5994854.1 aminoglycoside phosphotransferase family protein [Pseudomonas californiensis]MCD6000515.1 aminoglycoside phosphotransferase family protein [Pseudomonas californiensis]